MSKIDFASIVNSLLKDGLVNFISDVCPDRVVGYAFNEKLKIRRNDNFWVYDKISKEVLSEPKVILILESPHIEEFKGCEPGPAQGKTGINFRKYFGGFFLRKNNFYLERDRKYFVILMNAIRYQCSLGFPTKYFRDKIFKEVWESGGKEDFKKRLKKLYVAKETIIINACSKGTIDLRVMVERAVCDELGSQSHFRITHPSSWWSKKNRVANSFSNEKPCVECKGA